MTAVTGRIDVIVEDKNGKIKHHTALNNLTQAALAQMLVAGLSADSLNELFRIQKDALNGQAITVNDSSPLQLYCLTDDVAVAPKQNYRLYLNHSQRAVFQKSASDTSRVSFHTGAVDQTLRLHPHTRNCAMVGNESRYSFEYRSHPDLQSVGYIRGIMIGVAAFDKNALYGAPSPIGIRQTPRTPNLPFANQELDNPYYAVQHNTDRGMLQTVVWKSLTPGNATVNQFNVTTGNMQPGATPNFFFDDVTGIDFSGGLIVPGDSEAQTFTVVKAFLKGAENLPAPVIEFSAIVTVDEPGHDYCVGDVFSLLDGNVICTVTEVNNGGVVGVTATLVNPAVDPLGSAWSIDGLQAGLVNRSDESEPPLPLGVDAIIDICIQKTVNSADDWNDANIAQHYDAETGLVLTLAWRCDITGTPSEVFTKDIPITFSAPLGEDVRAVPVMVWRPETASEPAAIEIFYVNERDSATGQFALCTFDIDPFTLTENPANVVLSQQRLVGHLPYAIGHKSPRFDGQHYARGFYDPKTDDYYFPLAQYASRRNEIMDVGVPGALLGIRLKPRSGVLNAPAIVAGTIRNYEIFASDYYASDADVHSGFVPDFGTYHYVYTREGVGQMVLYGTQPNKSIQYVNLDYVWSGATFTSPIDKAADDLLRVIYSYELGNSF